MGGAKDTGAHDSEQQRVAALEAEVARLKEALGAARDQRVEDEAKRAREVRCPKCRFIMEEKTERGIVVDVCPGCRGVYFDDGEVSQLMRTIESERPQGSFLSRLFGR